MRSGIFTRFDCYEFTRPDVVQFSYFRKANILVCDSANGSTASVSSWRSTCSPSGITGSDIWTPIAEYRRQLPLSRLIWDFMQKEECRRVLKERKEPAAIIKFSDTMMGCLIIAFYSPKNKEGKGSNTGMERGGERIVWGWGTLY